MGKISPNRFLTLHPAGKQGVNIERAKYDAMRSALLAAIPATEEGVPFRSLAEAVRPRLGSAFAPGDSVMWYVTAVKQDLEARGELELVPRRRPQHLRRAR